MELTITSKPGSVVWSKLPIRFMFNFADMDPTSRIHIQFIDQVTNNVLAELTYPFAAQITGTPGPGSSIEGNVTVYAHKVLDPNVAYALPTDPVLATPTPSNDNIKRFFVQYRAIGPTIATPTFTVDNATYTLVKGGIGDMYVQNETTFNNGEGFSVNHMLPGGSRFLTWVPSGRLMAPDEYGWLKYFSDSSQATQYVNYKVTYLDGSTGTVTHSLPAGAYSLPYACWDIPVGINQCSLDPDHKGVYNYTVYITLGSSTEGVATYIINADNRPHYNTMTVYYRNSMGGLDQLRFRGDIERSIDGQKFEALQSRYEPANTDGSDYFFDSTMQPMWKANTGYLSRQHQTALAEMIGSTFCAILMNGQWLQLSVPAQKLAYDKNSENLHNTAITFQTANTFRSLPRQLLQLLNNI